MDSKVESDFIKRLNQGDAKAFDQLFVDKHQQVYAYCYKLIRSAENAEEVMMDVFLTLWKKRKQLTINGSFDALIFKITRDLSFNYLKKMIREQSYRSSFHENWTHPSYDPIGTQILTKDYDRLADHAINQLPPQCKAIFIMRRQMEMSTSEISQQLGISKSTVKVQLAKASKFLKEYFTVHSDISLIWVIVILNFLS